MRLRLVPHALGWWNQIEEAGLFIKLSIQEYRWLAIEMVRFYSSKGEPLWVRTFKGANRCLLQLRKNVGGRFIVFSLIGGFGQSGLSSFRKARTLMVDGWFPLTRILNL